MISSYSLSWIGMLYDYWMMRDGHQWLRQYLPAARHIIGCYEEYLRTDKSLARMPHWFFADWATGFDYGEPNYGQDGSSAYQDLVFVMALREQAAMEKAFGLEVLGNYYHDLARQITAAIKAKYWNSARGLLADTPEHDVYSQHVNALAILAEVLEEHEAQEVCRKMLDDTTLIQ